MAIYELVLINLRLAAERLWQQEALLYAQLAVGAVAVITSSCVVYSLFFSPYRHIPGRLLFRLSQLPLRFVVLFGRLYEVSEADYYAFGDIFML
ncbi:hypothetical protein GGI00_002259, partial [Coemansia sp. RSA 2681]